MHGRCFSKSGRRRPLTVDSLSPACQSRRRSLNRQEYDPGVRLLVEQLESRLTPSFNLGASADYALLFEGARNSSLFQVANITTNVTGSGPSQGGGIGDIGVGNVGKVSLTGPGTINGNLDVSASNTGQVTSNGVTITGTTSFGVAAVTSALDTVNALNITLGALSGTNPTINGNTTINASAGTFHASGNGYTNVRVFTITAFNLNNGQTLTINGDANGDSVVFNFAGSTNFHGNVVLTGGLSVDNVIFNFIGGDLSGGGPTLDINTGSSPSSLAQGIFLDPDGQISVVSSNVFGRVFGGDSRNLLFSGSNLTAPGRAAPTVTTAASPTAITLGATAPTLTDTAVLAAGQNPTGSLVFTLTGPGGFVYRQTDPVSGNGAYTASTPLATTGIVVGTYTWSVSYGGDVNNNPANDQGGVAEQTVVMVANPTIVTTASPAITLGTTAPTLSDTAVLSEGYFPGGSIVFTLTGPGGFVFTQTDPVSGNGAYTASTRLPTTGTAAGTYTWTAHYIGDVNNNAANDQGGPAERTVVSPANPTIVTAASPNVTLPAGPPGTVTLSDAAVLSGGYFPGGSIVFTLTGPGGFVFTQTDPVSGNGTYTASTTLPSTGTVAGTYTWSVTYGGDVNNRAVTETGSASNGEQTVVRPANPKLVTTAAQALRQGTLAATLSDMAVLSGGYFPGGSIVFTLSGPGGFTFTQTDPVSGNGIYTASTLLPTTGTVAGTYTWTAHYAGDVNNNAANDQGGAAEQVLVAPTSPTLVTTASPAITLGTTAPTLTDTAVLAGGLNPTGSLVFTLTGPGGFVYTQTDAVNGNGAYTASTPLATSGAVAGTYSWSVSFGGDVNNNAAIDQGGAAEQTVVSEANPTLVTTPGQRLITLGVSTVTLTDTALLADGYHPTGIITFTLVGRNGTTVDTEIVSVNGNGEYTTPTGYTLKITGGVTGIYQWNATYSGNSNNNPASDNNNFNEQVIISKAGPTVTTTPSPSTVTLDSSSVTLTDAADLEGGSNPTGTITFMLVAPSGGTVDTEIVTVNGNGIYMTPNGFTLPTSGTEAGTYQWNASYSGDNNDDPFNNINDPNERVTVSLASPTIVTTAGQVLRQGTRAATLTDTAVLSGGYFPGGSLVFTLTGPGGFTFTQTDPVSGNGAYTASTPLPTTGTVQGVYTWTAHYAGDANNNAASDQGGSAEQVTVALTSPTLVTTASPALALGTTAPTLTDSAVLAGGLNPTGSLVFTLTGPGGFTFTQTDPVNGNGAYTASTPLATAGAVAGTYSWSVTYEGDVNNNAASDQGGVAEQTVVSAASPTLVTTASPALTLGTTAPTLSDTAVLAGGYVSGGNLVFTLTGPAGFVFTQTDAVNGNATYTASTTLPTAGTVAGAYTWTVSYEGDVNNNATSDQGGPAEQTVVSPASPTIVTTASPAITLGTTAPTLSDTAVLSGGYFPGGSIVFTLTGPGGFVYTQTDPVSGNSTYTASTPLPTTGTVAGVYTWSVTFGGDANNRTVTETGSASDGEQTVVSAANPTIMTLASQALRQGIRAATLTDTAVLAGGYFPGGSLVFTLAGPGGFSFTQTDPVSGNGTYTASTPLPITGTVAGAYTWTAHYAGDVNNNAASDQGGAAEQVIVAPTSPTLVTTASPALTLGSTAPTLTDTAVLAGGLNPTGSLVFTLTGPGGFTFTQTDPVNGNGIYTASTPLATAGTVAGTYSWSVTYEGDVNNNAASDQGGIAEQTVVSAANPTIVTTASPAITLGTTAPTLSDTAVLSGGYVSGGNLVFTLTGPGGFVFTQTDPVSGNGTYTASTTLPTAGTVAGTYTWTVTYGGDVNNNAASDQGGPAERTAVSPASPTVVTTASPNVTLPAGPPGTVTLSDTAVLSGGYFPGGNLVFTLTGPGNFSFTQTDPVSGNGTYTASTPLPTTGTVAGTYTWSVTFGGDANNRTVTETGSASNGEQAVVSPANPRIVTLAGQVLRQGTRAATLTDTAVLAGGYFPGGSIVFTLTGPGGFTFTQTDPVSGNGAYTASTPLPITGTVAGTYTWTAHYAGDANNNAANDQGGAAEQVIVALTSPTLVTTASPALTLGSTAPTLTDSAVLAGGLNPTGSIVFTLTGPGGFVYTQTDPVNGNGAYTASTPLATAGTVAGAYSWSVTYEGDVNNNAASDQGGVAEQTVVSPANPLIVTTASPAITLGTTAPTLSDTAVLSGGYVSGGNLVFTLTGPGGFVFTQTDAVSGNATYTASTTLPTTGTAAGNYTWTVSYEGDVNNNVASDQGGPTERTAVSPASPTIVTTASPNVTLPAGPPGTVTLSDTAVLSGGYFPGGNLVFTLTGPGNFSFTQTDPVSGNGAYTASTTLPTTGTVAGTYTWTVTFGGDANNRTVTETGSASNGEQTEVGAANPRIVTTAGQVLRQGTRAATLTDTAVLAGGYFPGGSIVFTLSGPGGFTFTQTDPVNGNGAYTASTPLPITGTVAGTYTWTAHYAGDANNNAASDQGGPAEQVIVAPTSPTLVTTASPALALGSTAPTLTDTAVLAGGLNPTGSLVFTLTGPGGFTFTQTDPVNGNGAYTASTPLATAGTVAGAYSWSVSYEGDVNNNAASDQGGVAEQTVVSAADPTIVTTASPAITLGTTAPTLSDTAVLSGGYVSGGNLVFTLTGPGGFVYTQTDAVSGNATYTASTTLPTAGTVAGTYTWTVTYGGDVNNNAASDQGGPAERTAVSPASPTVVTTASPNVTLPAGPPGTVTLSDTAVLSGGYFPGGSLVFTLTGPGGFVYTQTDPVSGNGTYTASTTLPTTGTVAGTYTWSVTFGGDANNRTVTETGSASNGEQTEVGAANPRIVTLAGQVLRQGTRAATLTDTAVLSGGYFPGGSIVFTLTGPGGFTFTQTDPVSGNGAYTASTPLPITGTVAGTYTWTAHYAGDANNNAANDQGGAAEQVIVAPTSPTLVTTASPALTLGTTAPTLTDSAVLAGGLNPTGSLVFTLTGPGGFVYTQSDPVNGNGAYTASTPLATAGTVAGAYSWSVTYEGDVNNNAASDQGGVAEQTVVSPANPLIVTTASPAITLGTTAPTLSDTAVLSGGYVSGGNLVFTLTGPAGFSFTQTDPVSGNATYTASTTLPTTGTAAGTYTWTVSYEGDVNNNAASDQGGPTEQTVVMVASPTLVTTASPNVTLPAGPPGTVTLSDSAVLAGGYFPGGSLVFTLTGPGGFTFTQTDPVSGNGTYTASTTLPTTGTVAGTYTWTVTFGGDANNRTVNDQGGVAEQTVVSPANPTIVTTAGQVLRQGTRAATLSDTAVLSGGYFPGGSIVFTLTGPGGFTFTQTDPVSGNGAYTASTPLPTTGTVAGTYTWTAHYAGDANNNGASDQGGPAEQVIVALTSPTLVTTASPALTLGSTAPTLTDSAVLAGGLNPTGSLVFTLTGPGGFTFTQRDPVNGNGAYTASTPLATAGTVAGTYSWSVTYEGDVNNNAASDQGGVAEQTVVSAASPTIVTTASPALTLGTTAPTLSDTAVLSGGYVSGGSLVFTLTGPGGFVYTQTDAVSGNATYTASTTLPTTGTVAGAYTWTVSYGGDVNNNPANDQGGVAEQTVVSPANPTIVTTASPNVTLPAGPPGTVTLTDSAVLAGGYFPTGNLFFTLTGPGGFVYTQTDPVSGNGAYTASATLPTTGTVAGTYTWTVTFGGDANNRTVTETGSASNGEQTEVGAANPRIVTTAGQVLRQGTRAATLTDTAVLAGGYFPGGSIVFTLTGPGGFTFTQTDPVSGNGAYTASTPLPTTGTVAGTYTWTAHYAGDANNNAANDQGGAAEQVIVAPTSPTLVTTASPALTLGSTAPTLTDTAVLAGGLNPTGSIVFTLTGPGGFVYTQTDPVNGNGAYTASTPLATAGTVAGAYSWSVTYEGDVNNNAASDQGGVAEQTVVSPANPTLVTTASPAITLGTTAPTLSDTAVLSGGYVSGGNLVFTLTGPGGFVYTQTDPVSGNGTYTASTTLPATGTVAGVYTWTVTYEGDFNNNAANDQGGAAEQTVVSPASPTIVTTASPNVTLPAGPPGTVTLTDSAVLAGGYFPGGSIVFTLTGPGGFVYTQTDPVSGNGTYTASASLPTTGTVAGTYTWSVTFGGDANNRTVTETGSASNGEQTEVGAANPTIVTTAGQALRQGIRAATLTDTAVLAGGYVSGGSIVFTLSGPGGFVYTQSDPVNGNGAYTASTPLPTTGTVAGTYTWTAHYAGDANNNGASDQGGPAEQVVVAPTSPTLVTTASPALALGTTAPTLTDSAVLAGGLNPTGSLVFTLTGPGGFTYTQTDPVNGNGRLHGEHAAGDHGDGGRRL